MVKHRTTFSSRMTQTPPARHWIIVINNPKEEENPKELLDYDYLIVAREHWGPDAVGTPHFQCYVCLKKKSRLSQLKKVLPRANFQVMRGTPKQASDYCKKEGNFEEFGLLPPTGAESVQAKWQQIHDLAKAGDISSFYEDHQQQAFLNAQKFYNLVHHYRVPKEPLASIDARWYMGPSGTGKSLSARNEFPELYLKPSGTKWWPDYEDQEVVLLDDLGKTHGYMLEFLKNWADHYPFRAETKGGHTSLIRPKVIIVTTQYHWNDMTDDQELREAIERRFKITEFDKENRVTPATILPPSQVIDLTESSMTALPSSPPELSTQTQNWIETNYDFHQSIYDEF